MSKSGVLVLCHDTDQIFSFDLGSSAHWDISLVLCLVRTVELGYISLQVLLFLMYIYLTHTGG